MWSMGILLVMLVGFFMYHKSIVSDQEDAIIKLQTTQQMEVRELRDNAIEAQANSSKKSKKTIDSLKIIKNEIVYQPYIKYQYINMDYERAFSILSESSYSEGGEQHNDTIGVGNNR